MKILYVSPENTVGLLTMWETIHVNRGNQSKFITMYRSKQNFNDGLCLDLPFIGTKNKYINARNKYYKITRGPMGDQEVRTTKGPYYYPNIVEKIYFPIRDRIWRPKIESVIKKHNLLDYDIYHFEWGLDIYRNFSFVKRLKKMRKPIIAHYHGQDLRIRGVLPKMDQMADLNLTSEIDLMAKYDKLTYLPLPFIFPKKPPDFDVKKTIKICHSTTNRYYKGSEIIISACRDLVKNNLNVKFILIENKSHAEAMKIKKLCDINIDQICNRGGWGYGMNSVEAMSMGLCVATEINNSVKSVVGNNPFVNINQNNLYEVLNNLVKNPNEIQKLKKRAFNWGVDNHDINNVGNKLYQLYKKIL